MFSDIDQSLGVAWETKRSKLQKKLVTTMLQHLRNILFGFQALQRVDV